MNKKLKLIELNSLDQFRNDLLNTIEPGKVQELLSWFLESYGGINFKFGYSRPIFRARKCLTEHGYDNIREIYPPPSDKCKTGRMNEEGQAVFYGAFSIGTALAEINAQEGDYVQIANFLLPENGDVGIRCFAIGEVYNVYHGNNTISSNFFNEIRGFIDRIGKGNLRDLLTYLYMDAFSAEILNSTDAYKTEYIYSRVFSRLLLGKHPSVDGLIYTSAKIKGTTNIVLRPEIVNSKMQLVSNVVMQIIKVYPYGIVDFRLVKSAKGHTLDGVIVW